MAFKYNYFGELIESDIALNLAELHSQGPTFLRIKHDRALAIGGSGIFSPNEVPQYRFTGDLIQIDSSCYLGLLDTGNLELRLNVSEGLGTRVLTQILIEEIFPIISFARGELQLHASAVALGKNAYCFLGNSGAGKSTLAMNMLDEGFKLIDDDRVLLRVESEGITVRGNRHPLRLVSESRLSTANLSLIRQGIGEDGKIELMPESIAAQESARIAGLFQLSRGDETGALPGKLVDILLEVLESVPLSWFFSKHFGDRFMVLFERFFGKMPIVKLVRTSGCDPRLLVSVVIRQLAKNRQQTFEFQDILNGS